MKGKRSNSQRRRRLMDVMGQLGATIDREFADVDDIDYVLVVQHGNMVSMQTSLADQADVVALLQKGVPRRGELRTFGSHDPLPTASVWGDDG